MIRVRALWCYPIKSLGGVQGEALAVDARGAVGDHAWAVITESGKIGSGKTTRRFERVDGLLGLRACFDANGEPAVELDPGRTSSVRDPATAAALSRRLGRPVTLAPEDRVRHFDVDGVHLLSEASLDTLRTALGHEAIDARRFRPNVVLEGAGDGHPEDAWLGRELTIGGVRLEVTTRAERCVMVDYAQPGLPASDAILRHLARTRDACLGVYARVVAGGLIKVGDEVTVGP